jgi:hypothetical protein
MSWDASHPQVIDSVPAAVHPRGQVGRTLLFRHQPPGGAPSRRMLLNASDTHLSLVDVDDLRQPRLLSSLEVAPFHQQSFRFGEHLVEQVTPRGPRAWPRWWDDSSELRVRRADTEDAPVLARLEGKRVRLVLAHGNNLVLFVDDVSRGAEVLPKTEVQIVDMRDPSRPRPAGKLALPAPLYTGPRDFVATTQGFTFHAASEANWGRHALFLHLDLRDPDAPKIGEQRIPLRGREVESVGWMPEWIEPALIADPAGPEGFYLSFRREDGTVTEPHGGMSTRYRYFVQRWQPGAGDWKRGPEINVAGPLLRTWRAADGNRLLLSEHTAYRRAEGPVYDLDVDTRLSLMREESLPSGPVVARLLDSHVLVNRQRSSLILEGDRLVVTARRWYGDLGPSGGQETSDRLLVFDLAGQKLQLVHDQPSHLRGLVLLGSHRGNLLVSAGGDGILAVDLSNPASPRTAGFLPTGDHATHVEFIGDDAHITAGHRGLLRLGLGGM